MGVKGVIMVVLVAVLVGVVVVVLWGKMEWFLPLPTVQEEG